MITKLTNEQKELLEVYKDKWIKIGLCTDRVDKKLANWVSDFFYENIIRKPKVPAIIMPSPLSAFYTMIWWKESKKNDKEMFCNLTAEEKSEFIKREMNKKKEEISFIYPYIDGQFMSSYFSFYDYVNQVLGIKFDIQEKYDWYQKTSEMGIIYPLDDICIISDRPEIIKMVKGILHCATGPAIFYTDGFSVYVLNGVRVPKEIVETPAEKLDAHSLLTEKNAEVRREIVRKIGIERVCQKLNAKVLDVSSDGIYELLNLDLGDGQIRPYLKMQNPSIGIYHIEGIPVNIKTVADALKWRNQSDEIPEKIT